MSCDSYRYTNINFPKENSFSGLGPFIHYLIDFIYNI